MTASARASVSARPPSFVYAADNGKWNFAWALHAGVGYKVSPNVTIELAYSYMNLGDATTGANTNYRRHSDPAVRLDHEEHHLQRPEDRRALEPLTAGAGLRSAAGHQGLIERSLLRLVNGAGSSRAVFVCASARSMSRFSDTNVLRDND